MPIMASHSPLNISEIVRDRGLVPKDHQYRKWSMGIKRSRDRRRHVTLKGQTCDPNTFRLQYRENSWRCYLATIANYYDVVLRSAIYPSDSLASCCVTCRYYPGGPRVAAVTLPCTYCYRTVVAASCCYSCLIGFVNRDD